MVSVENMPFSILESILSTLDCSTHHIGFYLEGGFPDYLIPLSASRRLQDTQQIGQVIKLELDQRCSRKVAKSPSELAVKAWFSTIQVATTDKN